MFVAARKILLSLSEVLSFLHNSPFSASSSKDSGRQVPRFLKKERDVVERAPISHRRPPADRLQRDLKQSSKKTFPDISTEYLILALLTVSDWSLESSQEYFHVTTPHKLCLYTSSGSPDLRSSSRRHTGDIVRSFSLRQSLAPVQELLLGAWKTLSLLTSDKPGAICACH